MEYTLLMKNYNTWDNVLICCQKWLESAMPPTKIIIMDDGSNSIIENPLYTIYRFPHTSNAAQMFNTIQEHIETEYYVATTPYIYPSKNYMSYIFSFEKTNPNDITLGMMAVVNDYNADYELIFTPPLYIHCIDSFVNPPSIQLFKKSTYIGFNEAFVGWGYEDVEYLYRWTKLGHHIYRSPNMIFYYVKHDSIKKGEYYENVHKNELLCSKLEHIYDTGNIPDMKKIKYYNPD